MSARTRRRKSASFISDTPYEGMISFSLGSQPAAVSSFGKHFSKTLIAMKAAVDAPGEAPSSATSERSAARDEFSSQLQQASAFDVGLDDLDALPRDLQPPVIGLCVRIVCVERRQSFALGLKHLLDQIFCKIRNCRAQQRATV